MTTSRFLLMCLAASMMPGCAMLSTSSAELIAKGKKSSNYCFSEDVASVASKIVNYFEACDVREEANRTTPGFKIRGWTGANDEADLSHPDYKDITYYPVVKSLIELYPDSRRVSLLNENFFSLVANVTEADGDSACRTSVKFYTFYMWEPKFKRIEKYINTDGASGC